MQKLKIYNTLTRSKQVVEPIEGDTIRIYSCGLTVYDFAHIGNLRKYIFDDVLKRTLELLGYKTKHVMNITDVGHLTSDADDGDDKIEKGAKRDKKNAFEIAKFYENEFVKDLKKLDIALPDEMPRATDNIKEQVEFIEKLEKKGFTYQTSDGVYFDTSRLASYGELANIKGQSQIEGARVEKNEEKKNPTDFALWKFSPKVEKGQEKRDMEWPSPWAPPGVRGKVMGFPGWHLECSVMSTKLLGQPFEIHTGGVDHIGVHHTNEIAQSEAAEGKPLAKYFVHSEHLLQDGKKMAKSDGHFLRLKDLEEKGYSPLDFRFLCLGAHFQTKLNFSWDSLDGAKSARRKINDFYWSVERVDEPNPDDLKKFEKYMADNLDTPKALAQIFELINGSQKDNDTRGTTAGLIKKADEVLHILEEKTEIPREMQELATQRELLRKNSEFEKADDIRKKIEDSGYRVEDIDGKTRVKRA